MKIEEVLDSFEFWGLKARDYREKDNLIKFFRNSINRKDFKYLIGSTNVYGNDAEKAKRLLSEVVVNKGREGNDYPNQLIALLFANEAFQEAMLKRLNDDSRTTPDQLNSYLNAYKTHLLHDMLEAVKFSNKLIASLLEQTNYSEEQKNALLAKLDEIYHLD